MDETVAMRPVFFTIDEAARLTGLSVARLENWIDRGFLKPAIKGRAGRGSKHMVSAQQLLGLGAAAGLIRSPRGCSPSYAGQAVAEFESMDDGALAHWLGTWRDMYTEESFALFNGNLNIRHPERELKPGDQATVEDIMARLERAEQAIRERLSGRDRGVNLRYAR